MTFVYEVKAFGEAGPESEIKTSDGALALRMGAPQKNLPAGQKPSVNNPEHMIACGFASCFAQTLWSVAQKRNLNVSGAKAEITVQLNQNGDDGYYFRAGVNAVLPGTLPQADFRELVKAAIARCPFVRMMRPEALLFAKANGAEIGAGAPAQTL